MKFENRAFKFSSLEVEPIIANNQCLQTIEQFVTAVREEEFQRQYFYQVPISTISVIASEKLPIEV